mmetsp:Transcript_10469/g.15177  ORF Transcript_10469/g.15177 Transcript_10469/m.15177 type:complete len:125 (-) Transcript_10469:390-764(-)
MTEIVNPRECSCRPHRSVLVALCLGNGVQRRNNPSTARSNILVIYDGTCLNIEPSKRKSSESATRRQQKLAVGMRMLMQPPEQFNHPVFTEMYSSLQSAVYDLHLPHLHGQQHKTRRPSKAFIS